MTLSILRQAGDYAPVHNAEHDLQEIQQRASALFVDDLDVSRLTSLEFKYCVIDLNEAIQMKVVIQCSQCEKTSAIEVKHPNGPVIKARRCRHCGSFYDDEAAKEALSSTK